MGKSLKWMAMASQEPNECLFFTVVIQCGKLIYKQYRNIKSERNIKCRKREREIMWFGNMHGIKPWEGYIFINFMWVTMCCEIALYIYRTTNTTLTFNQCWIS